MAFVGDNMASMQRCATLQSCTFPGVRNRTQGRARSDRPSRRHPQGASTGVRRRFNAAPVRRGGRAGAEGKGPAGPEATLAPCGHRHRRSAIRSSRKTCRNLLRRFAGASRRRVVKPVSGGRSSRRFETPPDGLSTPLQTSVQPLPAGVADFYPCDTARPNLSARRQGGNAIRQRGSPTGRGVCAANSQGCRRIDDHVKTANYCRSLRAREHRENRQRRKAAWVSSPTFLKGSRPMPF